MAELVDAADSKSAVRKDVQVRLLFWARCRVQPGIFFMFFVDVINSINRNYIYVGMTNNMERRFAEHQSGKNRTTKPYAPFSIVLTETFQSRSEARTREKYLKSGTGKEFIKSLLNK